MSKTKNENIKTNATTKNEVVTINFTSFIETINALDENNELINGRKNNVQYALAKCGVMVNANSDKYVPTDAYVRFKNNAQFQLQYSKKLNQFVGFNIRLCNHEHEQYFVDKYGLVFTDCSDNQRICKSDFVHGFEKFNDIINDIISLPTCNRGVVVNSKPNA